MAAVIPVQDIINGLSKDHLSLPGVSKYVDTVLKVTEEQDAVCHLSKNVAICHKAFRDLANALKTADDGLDDYALGAGCKVKCTIWADDWIDEVYYNGKNVRSNLTGGVNGCCQKVFLEFDHVPGAALSIAAADTQEGTSAAFSFMCKSSDEPSCPWNFALKPGGKMGVSSMTARAFGISGPRQEHEETGAMKRPKDKQPPVGWTSNDFDDSAWGVPGQPTANWGSNPMWYKNFKWTFYRLKPSATGRALPVARKHTLEIARQLRDTLLRHLNGMEGLKKLAKIAVEAVRARDLLFERVPELRGAIGKGDAVLPEASLGAAAGASKHKGATNRGAGASKHKGAAFEAPGPDTPVRKADELTPIKRLQHAVDHLLSLRFEAENDASAAKDSGWGDADKIPKLFKQMVLQEALNNCTPDAFLVALDSKSLSRGAAGVRLFLCEWLFAAARKIEVHKFHLAALHGETLARSLQARFSEAKDIDALRNVLETIRELRKNFEETSRIRAPESVGCAHKTTLASHPGNELVFLHPNHKGAGEWIYYELGLRQQTKAAQKAVLLKTDGEFFWCDDAKNGACLDVSKWRYNAGTTVNLVAHNTTEVKKTKKGGGGRSFAVTHEGSLLCLGGDKNLVLGIKKEGGAEGEEGPKKKRMRVVLVPLDSPDRCIFEQFTPSASTNTARVVAVVQKLRDLEQLAEKTAVDAVIASKLKEFEQIKPRVLQVLTSHDPKYGREVTNMIQHKQAPTSTAKQIFRRGSAPFCVPKHMHKACKLVVPSAIAGAAPRDLVFLHHNYKSAEEWIYYEMALEKQQKKALKVAHLKTDGEFFWCDDTENSAVLDVWGWRYAAGNTVNLVAHHTTEERRTKLVGGGRSWTVCSDGALACRGCEGRLVLGMNKDTSRLVLVKPDSPDRCVLMVDEASGSLPKVCDFDCARAGVSRVRLDSRARALLVDLADFSDSVKKALEQTCGPATAKKAAAAATRTCVDSAIKLAQYTFSAFEPYIAERIEELTASLRADTNGIQVSTESTAAAVAAISDRLTRGGSAHEKAVDVAKAKGITPTLVASIKEARELLHLSQYATSSSTTTAAEQLTKIVKPLYLRTLDSAFLPPFLLELLDRKSSDDVVQAHYQRTFQPLPAYEKAAQSICLAPRFLRQTVILDLVQAMSKGRLAKPEVRKAFATDTALDQAAVAVIQQGWGLKTAAEARAQTDELSSRNVLDCIKDCFKNLQDWQRPYFTLALQALGGVGADNHVIKTKLAEVCDRSIHCRQMKVTSFNVLVRHAAAVATGKQHEVTGSKDETVAASATASATAAASSPQTTPVALALRRVYECMADYVDQHKDAAFRSSFVEPSKYYAHHSKLEQWVEANVETHAINYYGALISSTLGVHLPFMPLYWEDWPETVVDFWAGLDDRCWTQFADPAHFGLGHTTIKCMRDPTGFISDAGVARAQFPQGRRPDTALNFANDAVDPKCPSQRTKVISRYLERFAHFFSSKFFIPKAFHNLNSEQRPEHHGFRKASEILYQVYRTACPNVATADTFIEFCFQDDLFTVFSPVNVSAFWEWMGLLQPGTAALVAASDAAKCGGDVGDSCDVAATVVVVKSDKAAGDALSLDLLNKQLSEAMRVRDVKLIKRLMKERNALVTSLSK